MAKGPQKQTRKVFMQVLSLGMSKTATMSMQAALRALELGGDCYHGSLSMRRPRDWDLWMRATDAKWYGGAPFTTADWDDLLGEFSAVTDVPAILFVEELVEAYPEAKVILVERPEHKWLASFHAAVYLSFFTPTARTVMYVLEPLLGNLGAAHLRKSIYAYFHARDKHEFERNLLATYREHNARVRRVVPEERLLVYEMGSGWGPLCGFLGRKVPEGVEFPHLNETEEFARSMGEMQRETLDRGMRVLTKAAVPAGVLAAAWFVYAWGWLV